MFLLSGVLLTMCNCSLVSAQENKGSDTVINEAKSPDMILSDEMVVTVLSIERENREIPYVVQNVETANFSRARELNEANSLAGKVAGLNVIKSSSWVGSATRIVIRGNRSNTLVLTAGNEKFRTLFSYTNTITQGIVEHNKLLRNNFNLRTDGNLTEKLSFDTKVTYFNQSVDNRLATGEEFNNPMQVIYRQPSNISLEEAKNFEYFDDGGTRLQHYWTPGSHGGDIFTFTEKMLSFDGFSEATLEGREGFSIPTSKTYGVNARFSF